MKLLTNRQYETLFATISAATREIQDAEEKLLNQEFALKGAVQHIARLEVRLEEAGRANLEHLRTAQALAGIALLLRADPDAEIETDVFAILREVSDKVALIEEHIG